MTGSQAEGKGPAVVALGGGHGLAATLQAIRQYASSITAVVSVADDGGSSGRLREAFGIPAPGDLRKCLVALGDADGVWGRTFEHRFEAGELDGHAVGNLVLAGLVATTGDLCEALDAAGRLVSAVGTVLPATIGGVVLKAVSAGAEVEGQVAVAQAGRISEVSVVPPDAPSPPVAVAAIAAADQVVLGPGSLYTSVLAAAAPPQIRAALAATRARIVYVCNLRPQVPETAGYDVADHIRALLEHGLRPDVVVHHDGGLPVGDLDLPAVAAPLTGEDGTTHDPGRLAAVLAQLVG